jgi:predicted transposase/invertase (TIGR01784 family)
MYFLKNPELIPSEFLNKVPEVNEALEELKTMSLNKEFRAQYNAHIKAQNDRRSREANAKNEGIAIGEERGERKRDREIALKMLKKGNSIEDIADLTGLSIEEINSLKNK